MDLELVSWLASEAGAEALATASAHDEAAQAEAAAGRAGAVDPLRASTALRRALPALEPGQAAAVLTQVRLRERARPRLGPDVGRLLLTEDGSEQATRSAVAALRAAAYAGSGATHVADLGCGLGLDAVAFGRAGLRVTAVERDPVVAALARANVEALGLADAVEVREGDVTDAAVLDAALAGTDAAYADPARRDTARRRDGRSERVTDPREWSPPWSWVQALGDRVPRLAVKAAPGLPHSLTPEGGATTWTSVDGQLVEAEVAWPGLRADGSARRARVVSGGTAVVVGSAVALEDETPPPVGPAGTWLLEPDDAVLRAGLVGHVAALVGGRLLDPHVAYVTADEAVDVAPLATSFRIRHALPWDARSVRSLLRADGIGHVVVKKRATSLDPARVAKELRLPKADGRAVLILARVGDGVQALVCDVPETWA